MTIPMILVGFAVSMAVFVNMNYLGIHSWIISSIIGLGFGTIPLGLKFWSWNYKDAETKNR